MITTNDSPTPQPLSTGTRLNPGSTSRLTVAVLGPGGVGGLLGALLARDGHHVICLAGERTAGVIRRDGLRVTSGQYGDFTVPVEADTELRRPVDLAFVTVKQPALPAALDRLPARLIGPEGIVVPLLNGLDHLPVLRRHYPADQVVAGTIKVETTRTAPGRIAHTSPFTTLELAAPLDALAARLRHAGLTVALRTDEQAMLWDKLAFLAPFALLTTRHQASVGALRGQHRSELLAVLDEVTAVARAAGAPVTAESVLSFFDRAPAAMNSSMQRDVAAGRPIELDAIGGAVLRAGAAHGIDTPLLACLVAELSSAPAAAAGVRITSLDHLVLTVADVERTISFYQRVLGMRPVTFGAGRRALAFGSSKINLHQAGHELLPHAARPTPGSADLCLITDTPQQQVVAHLTACGVPMEEGPVPRTGAQGPITSTYLRDPDGNLVEISTYDNTPGHPGAGDHVQ
ncbi:2-dehydropantoate 2-reductase [Kitasatospora sp. GAS1066B]|uniref:2-dehydropantoate 2-reductase n=1 Tax=Kitasatospora sp. GAS1066B TaxID=3156271 RepID=UPI003518710B